MKTIIVIITLLFSTETLAFDYGAVKGQWAVYQSNNLSPDYYHFLNINEDFSGVLVSSFDNDPVSRSFNAKNVIKKDGYIEINFDKNQKAILSAWKLKSGSGKLNGLLFMYKENGDLYNMMHFPLDLLEKNHDLFKHASIIELSEKYR